MGDTPGTTRRSRRGLGRGEGYRHEGMDIITHVQSKHEASDRDVLDSNAANNDLFGREEMHELLSRVRVVYMCFSRSSHTRHSRSKNLMTETIAYQKVLAHHESRNQVAIHETGRQEYWVCSTLSGLTKIKSTLNNRNRESPRKKWARSRTDKDDTEDSQRMACTTKRARTRKREAKQDKEEKRKTDVVVRRQRKGQFKMQSCVAGSPTLSSTTSPLLVGWKG